MTDPDAEFLRAVRDDAEDRIKKATALMLMKNTQGWEILLGTFENMKADQLKILSEVVPGDEKTILAAHSVWYSVVHALDEVIRAVDAAIQDGIEAKEGLDSYTKNEDWS